ncbi:MAG: hypothetical protein IPM24_19840 [Bryobacterales bacterium]|nr:hypothetical protein [Bryobacterales bacterium]
MALERRMEQLEKGFKRLCESVYALRLTAVEDRPRGLDLALFDTLELACEDLMGWVQEGRQAAERGRQAAQAENPRLPRVRRAIEHCRLPLQKVDHRFLSDVASFERAGQLWDLARTAGKEWGAWAGSLSQAVEDCRQQVYGLNGLIFECCDELTDRLSGVSVSVHTAAVGQMMDPEAAVHPEDLAESTN